MVFVSQIDYLNKLCQQYEELNNLIKLSPYNTPLNKTEEKLKVFNAYTTESIYNPTFIYEELPQDWFRLFESFLFQLKPEASVWERLLYEDVRTTLDTLEALHTHDPSHITASTSRQYGIPQPALVTAAETIIADTEQTPIEEKNLTAEEAAQFMTLAFEQVGLTDWIVILEDRMNAEMLVRGARKELAIRRTTMFSHPAVKRLLVHEIGTHVFRKANGQMQLLKLLGVGLFGYLVTEEGMAAYHEEQFSLSDVTTLRRYALRVIAAYESLTHNFFDVFRRVATFTDVEDAFSIVLRAKRGFTDTTQYGSHVKDKVYLEGFINVKEHLNAFPEDYSLLMSGKVSLNLLPALRELETDGVLVPPRYLPEKFREML